MSRLAYLLIVLSLAATAASAQESVPLAFKYAPGQALEYDVMLSGSGGLRAPDGQFSPAGIQGSLRLSMTVAEAKPDGSARIQLRIPKADVQVNVAQERGRFSFENGKIRWFSNGREQSPPDADMSQMPIVSVPLEFVAAPNGSIIDVVMPKLPGVANMQQVAPGLAAPQLRNLDTAVFPDTPVKVGDTWRKNEQLSPMGPSMPVTVTSSRTLDSVSTEGGVRLAKISGYTESRFRSGAMPISPGGGAQVTVSIPDLRHTVTSTEYFDIDAGKLMRGDYDLSFIVRASAGMGGQTQEGSVEARMHVTVHAR